MYLFGPAIGGILPHGNIGTTEHPVYEGTPIDFSSWLCACWLLHFLLPGGHICGFIVRIKTSSAKKSIQEWLTLIAKTVALAGTGIIIITPFIFKIVWRVGMEARLLQKSTCTWIVDQERVVRRMSGTHRIFWGGIIPKTRPSARLCFWGWPTSSQRDCEAESDF